jgi:hypothetical protein
MILTKECRSAVGPDVIDSAVIKFSETLRFLKLPAHLFCSRRYQESNAAAEQAHELAS